MAKRPPDDELFEVSPEAFTARRNQLAKQLKEAGDAAEAKRVGALKKPTMTVWAVNQLARRKPEEIRELMRVAAELNRAQSAALHGRASDFLELGRKLRSEVGRLVGLAGTLTREEEHATNPAFARKVGATLQAAALQDPDTLEAGRLEHDLTPTATFGAPSGKLPPLPPKPKAEPREREREREREQERERERERERKTAQAHAKKVRAAADRAEAAAARAEREVDKLEKELHAARQAAVAARRTANDLARDATAAEKTAT
jgi:hypothetical protein